MHATWMFYKGVCGTDSTLRLWNVKVPLFPIVFIQFHSFSINTFLILFLLALVQIKNWRPLTFDSITENTESTLEDILGELTTLATLRIKLCRLVSTHPLFTGHSPQ